MEILPILLLVVLIVIVINQNNKLSQHLQRFEAELKLLRSQLLKFTTEKTEAVKPAEKIAGPEIHKPGITIQPYESPFKVVDEPQLIVEPAINNLDAAKINEPQAVENAESTHAEKAPENIAAASAIPKPTIEPAKIQPSIPAPTFFERHPDMEKFIGENLINKIGIAILVLAIGFFVKYAIDQQWIGPVGRVAIGIVCGGILVALAHAMRNSYKSFSSVLAGGGLAVFYFTITLAYHQFNLFSQTTAFVIMVGITIFASVLSLLYNKQELAIIALVGGFAAPFLVSNGSGNYKVLLTYLIILNSGLLVIAYNKAWRLLNFLSFLFTLVLFGSWLVSLTNNEPAATFKNGFLFATAFYLLYFVINVAHNIKEKKKFIASDFGILLAGTSLYFAAGIYCLINMGAAEFKGLFSACMGIFNLAASWLLFRKQKVDTNILYLLVGITLTFISITAPLQLQGNYITLFWACEAVLLYWLYKKSTIPIIQYSSLLVWLLMIVSLLMDWSLLYPFNNSRLTIIANKGFITTLFAAVATYLLFVLRRNNNEINAAKKNILFPHANVFRICAIVLLFIAGVLEINYQFTYYYPGTNINTLYLLLYTLSFISILTFITQKVRQLQLPWQTIALLLCVCIVLYLLCEPPTFYIQSNILTRQKNSIHFFAHWAIALVVATIMYRLIQLLRNNKAVVKEQFNFVTWLLCILIVIYLSAEISLLANQIFYSTANPLQNVQRIYVKTGLPILWGVCSFVFMWLGMHYKYRTLRIVSLCLFTITLLKLFIFDIRNIPAGGKIAAFFCLGILLLVVSFMYQRLKKIIIDNEAKVD